MREERRVKAAVRIQAGVCVWVCVSGRGECVWVCVRGGVSVCG